MNAPRVHRFVTRWVITFLVGVTSIFGTLVVVTVTRPVERALVVYTPQAIGRFDPESGLVTIPTVDGFEGATIRVGDTVPVRGIVTVAADRDVSVTGTVFWQQVPPGLQVLVVANVGRTLPGGTTQLTFENPIPDGVVAYVLEHGPTRWRITGYAKVNEPDALDATWETTAFWVVP